MYVPAPHTIGVVEPEGQELPAGQVVHSSAPAEEAKLPAGQSVHEPLADAEKLPAEHCSAAVAAAMQKLPLGQPLQPACDARSVAALQLPASHGSGTLAPSLQ